MRLSELLVELEDIAKENDLSVPYVVGGLPRDRMFGMARDVKDIDITTGDKNSFALAMFASRKWPEAHFRTYDDGHSSLDFKNIRLDFSNNFNLPEVSEYLLAHGIENATELQKEIYSRDFTINTLLQPMDLSKEPVDLTGFAAKDIVNRVLRTPVDPNLTIGHDPRRILRALKLALQHDMLIVGDLKDAMMKFRGSVGDLPFGGIKKQVNQMLRIDPRKTIGMLSEFKLLPIIPLSRLMNTELAKNRMVQNLLDAQGGVPK